MTDLRRISTGDVAIRAEADGDGRTLDGYAYRWGETTPGAEEYPGMLEGFERGAFQSAIAERSGRPWPYLDRHGGNVIGGIRFDEDATGLHYSGRLLDTNAAREYAATVEVNNGVSLEWLTRGVKSGCQHHPPIGPAYRGTRRGVHPGIRGRECRAAKWR
jgi:phage head maturation protease